MEIKEFGTKENEKILLIHGNMMCWKQFEKVIPLLSKRYHVIAVSIDGFDGTGQTRFTTAEASAKKLSDYIAKNLDGNIQLVFGESFGCATAIALFNSKIVQVDAMILNGAQYMDFGVLNKIFMYIIPRNQYRFTRKLEQAEQQKKIPLMLKLFTHTSEQNMVEMFRSVPPKISFETLDNCMKEAVSLYGEIAKRQPDNSAKVSIWYRAKEPNMKKAVSVLKTIYPNAENHPFIGMGHGEIIAYPKLMAKEIIRFMK